MTDVKKINVVVLLVLLMAGLAPRLWAEGLKISVPAVSDTGAFIVKLVTDEGVVISSFNREVELYRNKDGGEYSMIASGPLFKAVSQLVNHNGVYGYKVRWKNADQEGAESFSDEAFVKVNARVTQEDFARSDETHSKDVRVVSAVRQM